MPHTTSSHLLSDSDPMASTSTSTIREMQSAIPKRKREALESVTTDATKDEAENRVKPHRLTIRLPGKRKVHSGASVPRRPPPSNLSRKPSCLADVDAVVQDAALGACLEGEMKAPSILPPLPNWAAMDDGDRQDAPPESDDEVPWNVISQPPNADAGERHSHLSTRDSSLIPPPPLQAEPYVSPIGMHSMGPKPRLHVKPPIWAEVSETACDEILLSFPCSRGKKCASHSNGSGATRAVCTFSKTWSRDTFLGVSRLGNRSRCWK